MVKHARRRLRAGRPDFSKGGVPTRQAEVLPNLSRRNRTGKLRWGMAAGLPAGPGAVPQRRGRVMARSDPLPQGGGEPRLSRASVGRLSLYLRRLEGLFREGVAK